MNVKTQRGRSLARAAPGLSEQSSNPWQGMSGRIMRKIVMNRSSGYLRGIHPRDNDGITSTVIESIRSAFRKIGSRRPVIRLDLDSDPGTEPEEK